MRVFKVLVILFLVFLIIGGGAGAYYLLVLKPMQDAQGQVARPVGQPTPDPSTPEFEKASALRRERDPKAAREALSAFLTRYPESSHRQQAETLLGDINLETVFSPEPGPDKEVYIVRSGDTLDRIAHKTKSSGELIYRASNLDRINLQIGQKLIIPHLEISIEIHLGDKRVVLFNRGQFFRSYVIRTQKVAAKKNIEIKTKVFEKLAFKNGARVIFGNKEYAGSLRAVSFQGQPGYTVYGEPEEGSGEKPPVSSGLGISASDAEEFHTLVNPGTPASISSD